MNEAGKSDNKKGYNKQRGNKKMVYGEDNDGKRGNDGEDGGKISNWGEGSGGEVMGEKVVG
ncbi:hypothetical protein HYU14_04160 [Candidatus Woesearchaeota archaeon]|nr:hypothetical protein [Candidatus Woesearchaeota archaeon]